MLFAVYGVHHRRGTTGLRPSVKVLYSKGDFSPITLPTTTAASQETRKKKG
jgi:hypothetical protein